jgi:hypothetical protein
MAALEQMMHELRGCEPLAAGDPARLLFFRQ